VDGSSDDWVYGKLGIASFTYEIGPTSGQCADFFPPYGCQDGIDGMPRNFWAEMKPSIIYANKIARTPYITAYGPDTKDLMVDPFSIPVGTLVDLTGTVFDSRYKSDPLQNVYGAEYFIDKEGDDGTGDAMSPTDGSWGGKSEVVHVVVDTSRFTVGRHYILVHGKTIINNKDYWGPFTAVFLDTSEPLAPIAEFTSNSPVQLGQPVDFMNLTIGMKPINYTWDFGDGIGTSTETHPSYTYWDIDTYTVTLNAINDLGTDTITHSVIIEPPIFKIFLPLTGK
jgi:PKD repeat protein